MISESFFVNHPIFLKYKRRFDWKKLRRKSFLKRVVLNERIIEIPFAIRALTAIPNGGKVLDLGCMESSFPLSLAGQGFQVTGFDFREYPYVMPNFEFVQGDILDLPFENNTFDAVTCISTIEHIGIGFYNDPTQDQDAPDIKGMAEAKRVLKPQGILVLTVPFGKAYINDQQRVYDTESLGGLLDGFDVIEKLFFKNIPVETGNNYWQKITQAEAENVRYESGTECVACVNAIKKA